MPLFNRAQGNRERLLVFTREKDKLYDGNAHKIDNELISDKLGHAYDSPLPTQTFECLEPGREATLRTNDVVIVAEPEHPDKDTNLVAYRSEGHHTTYAEGIRKEQGNPNERAQRLVWGWLGISVTIFLILLWAGRAVLPATTTTPRRSPMTARATHPPKPPINSPTPTSPYRRSGNTWVQDQIDQVLERVENGPNLLKPLYGQFHQGEVWWHRSQLFQIVGGLEHFVQNGKTFGLAVIGTLLVLGFCAGTGDSPWFADLTGTFLLGMAMYLGIVTDRGYRIAFIQVHVLEFRDYTDMSRPTAHLTIWLPRLLFYNRPEVWAGSDGESGLLDSNAFILLYLPNRQRWQTLLHPRDFLDLPAFFPTLEGTNPRLRRTRLRSIVRNGSLDWYIKQLQKSQEQIKTWVWVLAGGGIILAGLLLLAFAPSGAPPQA